MNGVKEGMREGGGGIEGGRERGRSNILYLSFHLLVLPIFLTTHMRMC